MILNLHILLKMSNLHIRLQNGRTCPSNLSVIDTGYCINKRHQLTRYESKCLLVIEVLEVTEVERYPIELMLIKGWWA